MKTATYFMAIPTTNIWLLCESQKEFENLTIDFFFQSRVLSL